MLSDRTCVKRAIIAAVLLFIMGGCASLDPNPDKRNVNCSKFTSKEEVENGVLSVITTDGQQLNVVAIGSAREPERINFKYGKGCYIDLLRDVAHLERIDDAKQKVSLKNGEVIETGKYYSAMLDTVFTPYNISPWTVLVDTPNGIEYHKAELDPFGSITKLTVLNQPLTESQLASLENLKAEEQAEYSVKQQALAHKEEQRRAKREEQVRQAEREQLRLESQRQRAEVLQRDRAKMSLSSEANIGRKVCKFGNLTYPVYKGFMAFGQPQYFQQVEPGQLQAFLEGYSQDGYRIKFRVSGWANDGGRLKFNPSSPPMLGEFSTEHGSIYWDDVKDWFLCD